MRNHHAFTFTLLTVATGCLPDQAEGPELTGEVDQAVFGSTISAGGPGASDTVLVEKGADHTCYLRGIAGSLEGADGTWTNRVTASVQVALNPSTDHWEIHTRAGKGPGVWAYVSCVTSRVNRVFISQAHQGAGSDAPITTRRRCYLTELSAHGVAMMGRLPNGDLPGARVWTYGGSWRVGTWFQDNADESIDGHASAVCFDLPLSAGETGDHYLENADGPIVDNPSGDWACGALGVFGVFTGSSATGAYSYKSGTAWRAKATANHGVLSRCYR